MRNALIRYRPTFVCHALLGRGRLPVPPASTRTGARVEVFLQGVCVSSFDVQKVSLPLLVARFKWQAVKKEQNVQAVTLRASK